MARVKLSEFDAKRLLFPQQVIFSANTSTTSSQIKKALGDVPLVVKVDQGIKKRGKQGLVAVQVNPVQAVAKIREWSDRGFTRFLIEPLVVHEPSEEKYLSFEETREGWKLLYADAGGIEIESNWDTISTHVPAMLHDSCVMLQHLLEQYHIAFLELNPVIIKDSKLVALDAALLIDDAALGLAKLAPFNISPVSDRAVSVVENQIAALDDTTPASLKFRLINPEGKIWMFLSGGGASLVLADEVADIGLGDELANYGEYSGAPTDDDVYAYAKIILKQMLTRPSATSHQPLAIIIAGGVANFTDVGKTFKGLIRAMDECKDKLVKAGVKVFVRRGGPNEKKGLALMEQFLKRSNLYGSVHGHDVPLTQVVSEVKEFLT